MQITKFKIMIEVSIIIINYNTPILTLGCVNSILTLKDGVKKEIIIIDNGSKDSSVQIFKSKLKNKVIVVEGGKNLGFSYANNMGAKIANGRYILFLNSDTVIKKSFFKTSFNILKNKNIGCVSPRLKNHDNTNQKRSFGYFPTPWNLITQKTKNEPKVSSGKEYEEFDWISGCCLMITRENFKKINGWDENFFLYYEDIDLCYRLKKNKKISVVILRQSIVHFGGQSSNNKKNKKNIYYRSQDYYLRKHYNLLQFIIIKSIRSIKLKLKK